MPQLRPSAAKKMNYYQLVNYTFETCDSSKFSNWQYDYGLMENGTYYVTSDMTISADYGDLTNSLCLIGLTCDYIEGQESTEFWESAAIEVIVSISDGLLTIRYLDGSTNDYSFPTSINSDSMSSKWYEADSISIDGVNAGDYVNFTWRPWHEDYNPSIVINYTVKYGE